MDNPDPSSRAELLTQTFQTTKLSLSPLIKEMNSELVMKWNRCNMERYSNLVGQSTNMFSGLFYIFNKPHKMKARWKIKSRAPPVHIHPIINATAFECKLSHRKTNPLEKSGKN